MTTNHPIPTLVTLLTLAGCAAPPLPPAAVPGAADTTVHVTNGDPSLPLALYRVEKWNEGPAYNTTVMRSRGGGQDPDPSSQRRNTDDFVQSLLCLAPCEHPVVGPASEELFVGGDGIANSSHFRLYPRQGRVEVKALPRGAPRMPVGAVLVAVGGAGALFGSLVLTVGVARSGSVALTQGTFADGLVGAGAALLAVGIPLLLTGRTTYVFERPGAASASYAEIARR